MDKKKVLSFSILWFAKNFYEMPVSESRKAKVSMVSNHLKRNQNTLI